MIPEVCRPVFALICHLLLAINFDLSAIRFLLWSINLKHDIFPKRKSVHFIMIHFKKLFLSLNTMLLIAMLLVASNRIFQSTTLTDGNEKSRESGFRHDVFQPLKGALPEPRVHLFLSRLSFPGRLHY